MSFTSILVPLDGSSYSIQALPIAEQLAKLCGAVVHLVMVHQPPPGGYLPPEIPIDVTAVDAAAWQRESAYLEGVAKRFAADSGLTVDYQLLEGDVAGELREFVKTNDVDLVVMTTHGYSGIARLWLGSVANKLIRHLNVPVMVIRPEMAKPVERLAATEGELAGAGRLP